jgi:Ankyrin repeats (3 copies)
MRLSKKNKDFMAQKCRKFKLSLGLLKSNRTVASKSKLPRKNTPVRSQVNLDNFEEFYNARDGKFMLPFTGPISISRGTFQLSSTMSLKLPDSNSPLPALINSNSDQKLIQDMQKMIPSPIKPQKKFRRVLKASIRQMKMLKINPDELMLFDQLAQKEPYGRANSRLFFQYCKDGNIVEVERLLANDNYLITTYDPMKMTALHWAALRGHAELCEYLLDHNAFIDSVDYVRFI